MKSVASADSLGLQSLVGKRTDRRDFLPDCFHRRHRDFVRLRQCLATEKIEQVSNSYIGYYGTTESVTTYKVEPIQMTMVASGSIGLTTQEAGTAGNLITCLWLDQTDIKQHETGMTWIDCRNCAGNGIVFNNAFLAGEYLGVVRAAIGVNHVGNSTSQILTLNEIHANGNGNSTSYGIQLAGGGYSAPTPANNVVATNLYACNNSGNGVYFINNYASLENISVKKANCNGFTTAVGHGVLFGGFENTLAVKKPVERTAG